FTTTPLSVGPSMRTARSAMSMHRSAVAALMAITVLASSPRGDPAGDAPHLGIPMSHDEVAKWDLTIFPDGRGLPPGHGAAKEGRQIYERQCASCHGDEGQGATAEEPLGEPTPASGDITSKAIGPYWTFT